MINKKLDQIYLVAEIGWNFLGKLDLAKKMIKSAKKNGADAVKFQIWDPKYLRKGSWDVDGRREIYRKAFLDSKKYNSLKKFCKNIKIDCFASAFTLRGAKLLFNAGDKIIKIPSHEAYNKKLINYSIKNFSLIFLSVGALNFNELKKIQKYRNIKKLIPMHCVSSYPLLKENCNFFKFDYLKDYFRKVGYSGHYSGVEDAIHAISRGARVIEKHFSIDRRLPGRDNKFAILPDQLKSIRNWINITKEFNLSRGLGLQKSEIDIYKNYRGRWGV